jgi:hypothetical protein
MSESTQLPSSRVGSSSAVGVLSKVSVFEFENNTVKKHKNRIVIGSVVSADIRFSATQIAPIHAVIEISGNSGQEKALIFDLASTTGTRVNGKTIATQDLKDGDVIEIAGVSIKFRLEDLSVASQRVKFSDSEGQRLFQNPDEDVRPLLLEQKFEDEEVFDYRPCTKDSVEVIMAWNGAIMDVQYFVDQKEITIGPDRKSDFMIPRTLGEDKYVFVSKNAEERSSLNLDPKMKGVIQGKGRLLGVDDLLKAGTGTQASTAVAFEKNDFAKITIGFVDFYLSHTAAPPHLARRRLFERDAFFLRILVLSGIFSALFITAILNIRIDKTIEVEKVPERVATVMFQPEKFTQKNIRKVIEEVQKKAPEPEPKKVELDLKPKKLENKPIPKELDLGKKDQEALKSQKMQRQGQNKAKEGEGARAKGTEGSRDSKTAAPGKEQQNVARRPSPMGGTGAGGGQSQVANEGNIDAIKGATSQIQNLLGGTSEKMAGGGKELGGFGGFTTRGEGGLALSGKGAGGGGTADTSLGGLGTKGSGGGRVGTGLGAAGDGTGMIGGKTRVSVRTGGAEETVVMGSIDADAVLAALLAHKDEFRLCYEREVNAGNPTLAGRVGTSFVIGPTGRVNQAGIISTSMKNANVEGCILAVIRRIDFPVPKGGGTVQVRYPFKFQPTGG